MGSFINMKLASPEELDVCTVNLAAVVESDLPSVVQETAKEIQQVMYFTLDTWLARLSDWDLGTLADLGTSVDVDRQSRRAMQVLTQLLCMAEGVVINYNVDVECMDRRMTKLVDLIIHEGLAREGLMDPIPHPHLLTLDTAEP